MNQKLLLLETTSSRNDQLIYKTCANESPYYDLCNIILDTVSSDNLHQFYISSSLTSDLYEERLNVIVAKDKGAIECKHKVVCGAETVSNMLSYVGLCDNHSRTGLTGMSECVCTGGVS